MAIGNIPHSLACCQNMLWGKEAGRALLFGSDCALSVEIIYVESHSWMDLERMSWQSVPFSLRGSLPNMDTGSLNLFYAARDKHNPDVCIQLGKSQTEAADPLADTTMASLMFMYGIRGD